MSRPVRRRERTAATQKILGQATVCSHCGRNAKHSVMNFLSRTLKSLICSHCVSLYSTLSRMSVHQRVDYDELAEHALGLRIRKTLSAEGGPGTEYMKTAAATIAVCLARRGHQVYMARQAGQEIPPPFRYYVTGCDVGKFLSVLSKALEQVGLLVFQTTVKDAAKAEDRIRRACQGDALMAEVAGVILYRDGTPPEDAPARYSSVCVADHPMAVDLGPDYP